ncbi:probable serine/threonine-protein kinase fhkA [Haliotis rubra]|uniref:probable serine/threonine-protein kinase fhkA n=1 Tax=Haliotis rubra TaxID=36100 RepID=UPI001EE5B43B|nr:probable serine/threonine-protein kinase fhkA [Haliotis rubra]XP_046543272.1 probable serine/threonine-protein kinase fhkA [Haliotis rubra]
MDQETRRAEMDPVLPGFHESIAQQVIDDRDGQNSNFNLLKQKIVQDDDGHFPDDICFPAGKTGIQNVTSPDPNGPYKQVMQGKRIVQQNQDPRKEEFLFAGDQEEESVPDTLENLNVRPRGTIAEATVVKSITILSDRSSFHDVKDIRVMVKCSVEEESVDVYNDSQCVVLGSSQDVSLLFSVFDKQKKGTYGVITDRGMKPSPQGRYNHGKEFQVIKELGRGGFGQVDLCEHRSGKKYVNKKISARFRKKEVEVLNTLSHPNITGFLGYIFREGQHEILMEYAGVSLSAFIATNANWRELWTPDAVMRMAMQGFSALAYMHTVFEILHLDIKPDNICITYEGDNSPVIKLTDFGTSKTPETAICYDGWTPEYMSPEASRQYYAAKASVPECFLADDITGKSDVFAFGLTICYMLQGQHTVLLLWKNQLSLCSAQEFAAIRPRFIAYLAQSPNYIQDYGIPADLPVKTRELLQCLLVGDPKIRMTAEEALLYIQHQVQGQVTLPTILPPSSPSASSISATSGDLMTSLMTSDLTLQEISLKKPVPPGGGKDIKNSLRQKLLRRKSADPYHRHCSRTTSGMTSKAEAEEDKLPNFAALFD